jgi:hypothetical protein
MPPRLRKAQKAVQDERPTEQPPAELASQERRQSAVERARERAERQHAKGAAHTKDQAA